MRVWRYQGHLDCVEAAGVPNPIYRTSGFRVLILTWRSVMLISFLFQVSVISRAPSFAIAAGYVGGPYFNNNNNNNNNNRIYGTLRFITIFARAIHRSLSCVRSIPLRCLSVLSYRLHLSPHTVLIPFGLPVKILWSFIFPRMPHYWPVVLLTHGAEHKL
jgi:hypothetical protein